MARRQSYWDDSIFNESVTSETISNVSILTVPGGLSEGFTLVRTIVDMWCVDNALGGVDAAQSLDMGIGLVTPDAFAVGGASVPSPSVQTERPIGDWVWRTTALVIRATEPLAAVRTRVDLSSQRKLGAGTLFMGLANNNVVGTAFAVRVTGIVRCLILRP